MANVNKLWKWSLLFFFGGAVVSIVTAGRRKMWYTLDELSALNNCDSVWQVCVTMTVRLFFALFFLNIFNVSAFDSFLPQHFFTSFGARDRSFMMIFRLWQNALLDKVLTHYTLPAGSQAVRPNRIRTVYFRQIICQHDSNKMYKLFPLCYYLRIMATQ